MPDILGLVKHQENNLGSSGVFQAPKYFSVWWNSCRSRELNEERTELMNKHNSYIYFSNIKHNFTYLNEERTELMNKHN